MKTDNYELWYEGDHWADGEWTETDCNMDVEVRFEGGARWGATFFTFDNIDSLRKKFAGSGECMQGAYFWARHMILIDELSRSRIAEVVKYLLETGEFESAFELFERGDDSP
jgi:hypothetical protein